MRILLFFVAFVSLSVSATPVSVKETFHATSLQVLLGLSRLSNQDSEKIYATSARATVLSGLHSKWAFQADLEQAFTFSSGGGLGAAYTRLALGPSFAIMGSAQNRQMQILLEESPVLTTQSGGSQRLMASLTAEQWLLNGESRLLGLAGFGFGLSYFSHVDFLGNIVVSAKWARVQSAQLVIKPLQLEFGLSF
jgi:hypothetical protein